MRILRTYILKEFLTVFIFALLIINIIFLAGNVMIISIDMVIRKGVPMLDALKMAFFSLLRSVGFTTPVSFLSAILLTMGRLISDNETIAIRVAGISLNKILNIFLVFALIFSFFLFFLYSEVLPDSNYRYHVIKKISKDNPSALIEPGVFLDHFKNFTLYVSGKDNNDLKNIYIYARNKGEITRIIFAKNGKFVKENNAITLLLRDGFQDMISSDNKESYRMKFKRIFKHIPFEEVKKTEINKKPKDMHLKELWSKIRKLERIGASSNKKNVPLDLLIQFHERINFSFSVIAFALFGFGLSLVVKQRVKSINLGIAILSVVFYYLLFTAGKIITEYGIAPPWLGMGLANIVITFAGIILIAKYAHLR